MLNYITGAQLRSLRLLDLPILEANPVSYTAHAKLAYKKRRNSNYY